MTSVIIEREIDGTSEPTDQLVTLTRAGEEVIRQQIGILRRPEFVVVHRDRYSYPGILFEWRRRRQPDGIFKRSGRVLYMDGMEQVLRESWFLDALVDPSPQRPTPFKSGRLKDVSTA